MLDQSTPKGRIIAASLRLAAERPWADITLRDIAEAAGVSLTELREHAPSKPAILAAFIAAVDDEVLRKAPPASANSAARDALFDVIMSRFDALQPYRIAVKSITAGTSGDLSLIQAFVASQRWMLVAAGIGTDGIGGTARIAGLSQIYAGVLRTWLADDDPGLARTMAALDRRLRRGETTITSIEQGFAGVSRIARDLPGVLRDVWNRRPRPGGSTRAGANAQTAEPAAASDDGESGPASAPGM